MFQTVTDLEEVSELQSSEEQGNTWPLSQAKYTKKRTANFKCFEEDNIRDFKRVRLFRPRYLKDGEEIHQPRQAAVPTFRSEPDTETEVRISAEDVAKRQLSQFLRIQSPEAIEKRLAEFLHKLHRYQQSYQNVTAISSHYDCRSLTV